MPLQFSNYDPAIKAGANIDVAVDLTDITDKDGNEIIELDTVTSPVNYLRVTNSATGDRIELSARGDDTNVGINITPKGSGIVRFATATASSITTGGALDLSGIAKPDVIFVVATTDSTPLTAPGRTTANTQWVKITAGGTTRYISVTD